jgi:predicted PurR-regulated permease PerM
VTDSSPDPHPRLTRVSTITWRSLVIVAGVVVVATGLGYVGPVVIALFAAMLFAALAGPIMRLLRTFLPKIVAMILSLMVIASVVSTIFYFVIASVISEGPKVIPAVESGLSEIQSWLKDGPMKLSDDTIATIMKEISDLGGQIGSDILASVGSVLGDAGTFITAGSVFIFGIIFFLMSPDRIWGWALGWLPETPRRHVDNAGRIAWQSLSGYTKGIVVVALLDGLLVYVGLAIMQVPLAPVLAALVFLGAFIPVIGAPVATAFAAVVALAERGPLIAILVVALTVVVGSFDGDVLQPLVMGRAVNIHPLAIVVLIAAGAISFGIIGALVAVPIGSAAYGVLKYATGRDPDFPLAPPSVPTEPTPAG